MVARSGVVSTASATRDNNLDLTESRFSGVVGIEATWNVTRNQREIKSHNVGRMLFSWELIVRKRRKTG